MAKSGADRQKELRQRRDELGQKEMRGIYVTGQEELKLKPMIREELKRMRKVIC